MGVHILLKQKWHLNFPVEQGVLPREQCMTDRDRESTVMRRCRRLNDGDEPPLLPLLLPLHGIARLLNLKWFLHPPLWQCCVSRYVNTKQE